MRVPHRVATVVGAVGLVVGLAALTGSGSALRATPRTVRTPTTQSAPQLGPYDAGTGDLTESCSTPTVDLDPALKASGPAVTTVQILLQLPQDGVYGQATAEAVSQVQCPDVGLYAALQALQEASPALRDQAQARMAQTVTQPVSRPVQPPVQVSVPASPDCYGVNPLAADIYAHESGCRLDAINGGGCAGIGQACPGSKLPCSLTDAPCQLAYFENYALGRYGSWQAAYNFRNANNWW